MNRSLLNNAIIGASNGYEKILELTGVGFRAALKGNVLKYIWRYSYKKKPLEDLNKAKWYLDKLISLHDNDTS